MIPEEYETPAGTPVTAVTADEMRDVDRVAVEVISLTLTRMMEHAGRSLARTALETRDEAASPDGPVVVLAGAGGNGGGGLVCARHLANRSIPTTVVLDREPSELDGVPAEQLAILQRMDGPSIRTATESGVDGLPDPALVVDALLGYGLEGGPRGPAATLIEWSQSVDPPTLALDVPSGVDPTTGDEPGVAVRPDRTLTLALPKTGLRSVSGDLLLADLSIPSVVYEQLNIPYDQPFGDAFVVELQSR